MNVHRAPRLNRPGPGRPRTPRCGRGRGRGLSLVELMISLAITASLLTAVAAAFSATASATEVNDRFFRATQAGRVCLHQLLTEIRQCDNVVETNATTVFDRIMVYVPEERRGPNEKYRTFKFRPAGVKSTTPDLVFTITNLAGVEGTEEYRLAKNITGTFQRDTRDDTIINADGTSSPIKTVTRVSINIVVTNGSEKVQLSGAAAPRRAMVY